MRGEALFITRLLTRIEDKTGKYALSQFERVAQSDVVAEAQVTAENENRGFVKLGQVALACGL